MKKFLSWFSAGVERRQTGGDFNDAVIRYLEAKAAGAVADSASTAAVESAAGALSRSLMAATVRGSPAVRQAVTSHFLAQVGRDLIRRGKSLHLIQVSGDRVQLLPVQSWNFEGGVSPDSWFIRGTLYGPSTTITRFLPFSAYVFLTWGRDATEPFSGKGPLDYASTTAGLSANTELSLKDEASGPIAQILPIPQDGGSGGDDDPLKDMKADVKAARGKALLTETTAAGWGDGKGAAPLSDWKANRLGPNPPASLEAIRKGAFETVLAACGIPPSFWTDADGTSQREALRRYHLGTVLPLAKMIEIELTEKLDSPVSLAFDNYPLDLQGRASAFQKMVQGGMSVDDALAKTGLLTAE